MISLNALQWPNLKLNVSTAGWIAMFLLDFLTLEILSLSTVNIRSRLEM